MSNAVEWRIDDRPVSYPEALLTMEERVEAIRDESAQEMVWLLEHPPLYTAGTSAGPGEILDRSLPVYQTGRGGKTTYHGPGQRVGYVMLDLRRRGRDLRGYVCQLEEWLIRGLSHFNVQAERREGRVGLWVDMSRHGGLPGEERKIAAIGVRVRHWITYHGIAVNVDPDMSHFRGIVPCGIREHGVTSLAALGQHAQLAELDAALHAEWAGVFG